MGNNSKIIRFILFLGVFLFPFPGRTQNNCTLSISGSVLDEHTGEPLALANIYVVELSSGTITDSLGNFQIPNLCPGEYVLKISHLGCEPISSEIKVVKSVRKKFYLEHHAHILEEMFVSAEKEKDNRAVNLVNITGKELVVNIGKSLGEQLEGQTGISSIKTGNSISKPMIRGLYGSRVIIINNSLRLEGQQWGQEHGPEIDPFQANSIKIVKGAASIRYGHDAIGGVILLEPNKLPILHGTTGRLFLVGESNNGSMAISSFAEGKLKGKLPLSWRIGLTGKKAGNTKAPNYYLKNTGFEELDYTGALGYLSENFNLDVSFSSYQSKLGIFSATHFGNLTDLKNAFTSSVPLEVEGFKYDIRKPYQEVLHQSVIAKSLIRAGKFGDLLFNYGWQRNKRDEYDKEHSFSTPSSFPEQRFEIFTNSGELVFSNSSLKNVNVKLGLTGVFQDNSIGGRYFIPAYQQKSGGTFLIQSWRYGKWEAEGGLRYDVKEFNYNYWNQVLKTGTIINNSYGDISWNAGVKYKPTEGLALFLNHGKAWRPPSPNELFSNGIHHGAAAIEFGDTTLKKETTYFESFGLNLSHNKWKINTEVFYSNFKGFIYLNPTGTYLLTIKGAFPVFEFGQTNAATYGWEGKISREIIPNFTVITKFSLLRGLNISDNTYLVNFPGDRLEGALFYSFNNLKKVKSLSVKGSILYQFKQSRVLEKADFVPPPEGYYLINSEILLEIPHKERTIQLSFSVQNLLNNSYRSYLNRFRYFADEAGRNFALRAAIPFGKPKK